MHLRSIIAIARKDTLDILANRSTMISLVSVIVVAVLFLLVNNLLGTHTTKVLLYDPGDSGVERAIHSEFTNADVTQVASASAVSAEFGPDGAHRDSSYALGLVVPADFVSSLRAGNRPQLTLYVNGDQINNTDRQILIQLLTNYAGAIVNPQPVTITTATINPSTSTPIGDLSGMYLATGLLMSFITGTTLVPNLLIEEKEKKTLRMLMVSPATFTDVVLGKLLVGLVYQLVLSLVVVGILNGFRGNMPLLLLFILLGACFSLALGLLAGSIFGSMSGVGGFTGIMSLLYVVPGIFIGPLGLLLQSNPVAQIVKILPMYYLGLGAYDAVQNSSTLSSTILYAAIVLSCTLTVLAAAVWLLRRQAAVVAAI